MSNLEDMMKKQFAEKLTRKSNELEYYTNKAEELGLQSMDRFKEFSPIISSSIQNGMVYAHLGLEDIAEALVSKQPWSIVSGVNPSGPLHFGHYAVFNEVKWWHDLGAQVFIPITNDETYLVGKTASIGESKQIAYEQIIPSLTATGFRPEDTHMFVDTDYPEIYRFAMHIAPKLTLNKVTKVFGIDPFSADENSGTLFYRAAVQIAQILLPQLEEFGGPQPTLVPVGIDQHPYILLARDVAQKIGFQKPSALYLRFQKGLDGDGKMSTSKTSSPLFITEEKGVATKKLKKAYTGGSGSADFQRDHGGIPEICPVYELQSVHAQNNALYESCTSGSILCGECKKQTAAFLEEHIQHHHDTIQSPLYPAQQYLLTQKLSSLDNIRNISE